MSAQTACLGVKGHGIVNVPPVWYELSSRVEAARAVLYWVTDALPSLDGLSDRQIEHLNRTASLAVAAESLLQLCSQDLDAMEQALRAS